MKYSEQKEHKPQYYGCYLNGNHEDSRNNIKQYIQYLSNHQFMDDKNETMKWPVSIAPYKCAIIPSTTKKDNKNIIKANNISKLLNEQNIDTIIDDTDENFSSKMKKFNLLGIPIQITIGKKTEGDLIEFREIGKDSQNLKINQIIEIINRKK